MEWHLTGPAGLNSTEIALNGERTLHGSALPGQPLIPSTTISFGENLTRAAIPIYSLLPPCTGNTLRAEAKGDAWELSSLEVCNPFQPRALLVTNRRKAAVRETVLAHRASRWRRASRLLWHRARSFLWFFTTTF